MDFKLPEFVYPDFTDDKFSNSKQVSFKEAEQDGIAPDNYYLTTHLPTFYYYKEEWILPKLNSLNCVAVLEGDNIKIIELRNIKKGDQIVIGRSTDGSNGVFVHHNGFPDSVPSIPGKSAETSFSEDYEVLFKLMKHEREHGGYIVWILGPSVIFDHDTRVSLNKLVKAGYIHCVLAGNAMATHDLEGGFLQTALGQNIYTQENVPLGHYNHLDLLNEVRSAGSIKEFIAQGHVKDGFIKTLTEMNVPYVLAGSIRDDGPLPEVYGDTEKALDETRKHLDQATVIIGLATMLHTISAAHIAPSYRVRTDGRISPVYMYAVDITENVANKIGGVRDFIGFRPMITNVQDFVVNCERALVEDKGEM